MDFSNLPSLYCKAIAQTSILVSINNCYQRSNTSKNSSNQSSAIFAIKISFLQLCAKYVNISKEKIKKILKTLQKLILMLHLLIIIFLNQ